MADKTTVTLIGMNVRSWPITGLSTVATSRGDHSGCLTGNESPS
jgi:hypothetical protein